MKIFYRYISTPLLIATCSLLIFSTACKKEEDNKNEDVFMNKDWLLGTWEATTPAIGDIKFDNKKIKLVFEEVVLKHIDTVPNNTSRLYYYSGTLFWDIDNSGVATRSFNFTHSAYPTGYSSVLWQSMSMIEANATVNNISLRVGDTVSMDPNPEYFFNLDWGMYNDYTRVPPTYLDFFGDIEIYQNGIFYNADYLPDAGTMIRFTKK